MEKLSQTNLYNLLIKNNFDPNSIFFTPTKNDVLKEIFKHGSKKNTNHIGIPDLLYFEGPTIIIFECKPQNLFRAEDDLKLYKHKINEKWFKEYTFYYVSFVNDALYKIQDNEGKELKIQLYKNNFGLLEQSRTSINDVLKKIHQIHDYIRGYTKISDEEKPFFIAIILISIQKESFIIQFRQKKDKKYVYDLLVENLKDYDINISVFEFMRNHNSNVHLCNLITMILEIGECCARAEGSMDVLNLFYNEFVKYYNTDSKSLGIVLTPDYICDLMVRLLNIQDKDTILDLCTGTGSFLWKSLTYSPKKIIGCEYQTKLFSLLKCNNILRNKFNVQADLILDDCFHHQFECTKSIINPPFSQEDKSELDFVMKQLMSLELGGIAVSIIPISKITSRSRQRDAILKIASIKSIIILNDKVFYPCASTQCVILLLERSQEVGTSHDVKIIDFREDGYMIKRGLGKQKKININQINESFWKIYHDPEENHYTISCNQNNWLEEFYKTTINMDFNATNLKLRLLEEQFMIQKKKLLEDATNSEIEKKKLKNYKICELFDIIKKPKKIFDGQEVFLFEVSARKYDNGINAIVPIDQVDKKEVFDGNKIVLITGGEGGAGLAFYQEKPFILKSCTVALEPKNFKLDPKIGHYMALELSKYKQIYSRGYGWTLERIKQDSITLPIDNEGKIDFEWIPDLYK